MLCDVYDDILERHGFIRIGELTYRLNVAVWWQAEHRLQVTRLTVGADCLLKGDKTYYLKSISEEGETWARDIGPLQDYLEAHFPELHLSLAHFRDVPKTLAAEHVRRKTRAEAPTLHVPDERQLAQLQRQLNARRQDQRSAENLLGLDTGSSDLAASYVRGQCRKLRAEVRQLEPQVRKASERLGVYRHLQREYQRKGSAACLVFTLPSNLHTASDPTEFEDALASVVKELRDAHRYQVSQKLGGGKLNIHVAESDEPVMTWLEQWFGGALSPRQVEKLGPAFRILCGAEQERTMVTAKEDIAGYEGQVKDNKKLIAARVVSNLVQRLDPGDQTATRLGDIPHDKLPVSIGRLVVRGRVSSDPATLPLAEFDHVYFSGKTGSGKSYGGRVLVEEAARHKGVNILVLDPRNQGVGLLAPEDREVILSLYPDFGMRAESARGFEFKYYAPAKSYGEEMPADLAALARGRNIVSFKGLDDRSACELFRQILEAVFHHWSGEESPTLRQIIFVEEAQLFTRKKMAETAKSAGQSAENALDTVARERRKYGLAAVILSQTIRDFAYDAASIRQNTTTKFFLHNSDREVDYAADFIGDGRQIVHLPRATAIIHNPNWGVLTVKFRPPRSKVWEFSDEDTRKLVQGDTGASVGLSADAQRLLEDARNHFTEYGEGINLSEAGRHLCITSKRRLRQLVTELERTGAARTRKLRQRGQPRIIEPTGTGT